MGKKHLIIVCICSLMASLGCEPEIGDNCTTNSECSMQGDRVCDRTQPGGYCLMIDCDPDTCPGESVCVEFLEERKARKFCMRHCGSDGDCRDDYRCIEPNEVMAVIIDNGPNGDNFCTMKVPEE